VLAQLALGRVELAAGDARAAAGRFATAMAEVLPLGDSSAVAEVLEASAGLALAEGQPARAAERLGLATALRGRPDVGSPETLAVSAATRAALGEPDYDRAYGATAALTPADARSVLARES
jgi:hypothetical protein